MSTSRDNLAFGLGGRKFAIEGGWDGCRRNLLVLPGLECRKGVGSGGERVGCGCCGGRTWRLVG